MCRETKIETILLNIVPGAQIETGNRRHLIQSGENKQRLSNGGNSSLNYTIQC